jgi:hypothetical protein
MGETQATPKATPKADAALREIEAYAEEYLARNAELIRKYGVGAGGSSVVRDILRIVRSVQ